MYYAIIGDDAKDSLGKRASARAAHIARLQFLLDQGRVLIAGPHPAIDSEDPGPAGFTGSLIVRNLTRSKKRRHGPKRTPMWPRGSIDTSRSSPSRRFSRKCLILIGSRACASVWTLHSIPCGSRSTTSPRIISGMRARRAAAVTIRSRSSRSDSGASRPSPATAPFTLPWVASSVPTYTPSASRH